MISGITVKKIVFPEVVAKTIHFKVFFVNLGPKVISQRPGSGLERFLEVFCFNLTEHEPVRSHGGPIHVILVKKA